MGTPRLLSVVARAAFVLPLLVALSACAISGGGRPPMTGAGSEAGAERGPRVQLWTTNEVHAGDRVRSSFRLEDDAYVVVVNVGRDGYANVIFPESPEDDGFMRGGRTYRLPAFFPGFARNFRSDYRRLYNATSAYDDVYDRYAGYVFVIASWRPMHFQMAEALGLWDNYRLAAHEERLEPYAVMHRFASTLALARSRDYTARFARYAAFGGGAGRRALSRCTLYSSAFGYMSIGAFQTVGNPWIPVHGIDYFGAGGGCGFGGIRLVGVRPAGPIVVRPPAASPPEGGDTATKPRRPRPPRAPIADADSGRRKSPRARRVDIAVDEPIIDVTKERRDRALWRDRDTDRMRRAMRGERGDDAPDEWRRMERARNSERSKAPRDVDRGERRAREPADRESRGRRDSARGETRTSEPRPERPARSEPRSEPRGERPAKPDRQ
jgi:hypothetical protein